MRRVLAEIGVAIFVMWEEMMGAIARIVGAREIYGVQMSGSEVMKVLKLAGEPRDTSL